MNIKKAVLKKFYTSNLNSSSIDEKKFQTSIYKRRWSTILFRIELVSFGFK